MLVESPPRQFLLISNQEWQAGVTDGDGEADRDAGCQSASWWDKVAERWPNGGRFPSLIFNDQRA
jgi:hypothetical protein